MKQITRMILLLLALSFLLISCAMGVSLESTEDCNSIIVSYTQVTVNGFESNIVSVCPDGTGQRRLTNDGMGNHYPTWSPDGEHIVFLSEQSGFPQLIIMDGTVGDIHQLTENLQIADVLWLPDGERIAILIDSVWQAVDAVSGEMSMLDWDGVWMRDPAPSHDGTRLVYVTSPERDDSPGRNQVRIRQLDDLSEDTLIEDEMIHYSPAWSPDDAQLAFVSYAEGEEGDSFLTILAVEDSYSVARTIPSVVDYAWGPDQEYIAIYDGAFLYTLNLASGETVVLFQVDEPDYIAGISWKP